MSVTARSRDAGPGVPRVGARTSGGAPGSGIPRVAHFPVRVQGALDGAEHGSGDREHRLQAMGGRGGEGESEKDRRRVGAVRVPHTRAATADDES